MKHQKSSATHGGAQIRALREAGGRTQLDVELDASLGIGYLQRLERGKVQRPERETLERIVEALGVTFAECLALFTSFGYALPITTPNAAETGWAISTFHAEIAQNNIPVYLLDCSHRLLAWNALVPQLYSAIRTQPDDIVMPRLIFDPAYEVGEAIVNREAFFALQIRILHYEHQRCADEAWFNGFIDDMRQIESFDRHWVSAAKATLTPLATRPLAHLQMDTTRDIVQFRLIAQTFAQDPRFRVMYCLPADAATIEQCHEWTG